MSLKIITLDKGNQTDWDKYILSRSDSNLYHLSGWKDVTERTYGHKTFYLMAFHESPGKIVGILPLVHMRHFIFGNNLVSIPFFDMGGLLADDDQVALALLDHAISIGHRLKVDNIEIRHEMPFQCYQKHLMVINGINCSSQSVDQPSGGNDILSVTASKVRMLLPLPESSDELMKSFKAKLRSQIKRPMKEGLTTTIGGLELVDDFYSVFCVNMRDLGSPVHSKILMQTVLQVFPETARIVVVYKESTPVACSIVVGFKNILENPWASSLRQFSRLAPNMLLYWTMLSYACDNGYRQFDFGRSTSGEGTYRFKQQWGALPHPLNWYSWSLKGRHEMRTESGKSKYAKAIQYWQKLPVSVSRVIGPMVRKHVAL